MLKYLCLGLFLISIVVGIATGESWTWVSGWVCAALWCSMYKE